MRLVESDFEMEVRIVLARRYARAKNASKRKN